MPYQWLPTLKISQWAGNIARCKTLWFKNVLIYTYIWVFSIDLSECEITDYRQFEHFNDFFIRQLKPSARPLANYPNTITSPADGFISMLGQIKQGQAIQAKGIDYSIENLLGDPTLATCFKNGAFATVYLSPKDYHRVHMPTAGQAIKSIYVPGQLWPVKPSLVNKTPALFTKNERLSVIFETEHGKMAVVFVGAFIVGQIGTVLNGMIKPETQTKHIDHPNANSRPFNKGDELGYFCLGSTVIVLWESKHIEWSKQYQPNHPIKMGEMIGYFEKDTRLETTPTNQKHSTKVATEPSEHNSNNPAT